MLLAINVEGTGQVMVHVVYVSTFAYNGRTFHNRLFIALKNCLRASDIGARAHPAHETSRGYI